jgi:hypothetical protein
LWLLLQVHPAASAVLRGCTGAVLVLAMLVQVVGIAAAKIDLIDVWRAIQASIKVIVSKSCALTVFQADFKIN